MPKPKNLSPLELKHLIKYRDDVNRCSLQELSVEMGCSIEVLESYLESLGGLKVEIEPKYSDLSPEQKLVRESFAASKGAVMMTEATASLIEQMQGDPNFSNPNSAPKAKSKTNKSESSIFRGNKPVDGKRNPYDERRV